MKVKTPSLCSFPSIRNNERFDSQLNQAENAYFLAGAPSLDFFSRLVNLMN